MFTHICFLIIPYRVHAAVPFLLQKEFHASVNNIVLSLNCSYEYRLRVALGPAGELSLTSRVRNTNADGKPFSFTFAYHTYFSVSDIRYWQRDPILACFFQIFINCSGGAQLLSKTVRRSYPIRHKTHKQSS